MDGQTEGKTHLRLIRMAIYTNQLVSSTSFSLTGKKWQTKHQ